MRNAVFEGSTELGETEVQRVLKEREAGLLSEIETWSGPKGRVSPTLEVLGSRSHFTWRFGIEMEWVARVLAPPASSYRPTLRSVRRYQGKEQPQKRSHRIVPLRTAKDWKPGEWVYYRFAPLPNRESLVGGELEFALWSPRSQRVKKEAANIRTPDGGKAYFLHPGVKVEGRRIEVPGWEWMEAKW